MLTESSRPSALGRTAAFMKEMKKEKEELILNWADEKGELSHHQFPQIPMLLWLMRKNWRYHRRFYCGRQLPGSVR